ncbi:MAG: hypothetical protein ACP5NW_02365 [Candidatus Woesearchaeota archaeon]
MVDYNPQFRPIGIGNMPLIDRVSDAFWDGFNIERWKELKDDYLATTKDDGKRIKKDIIDHAPVYAAMVAGTGTSIIANYVGAQNATEQGYSHKLIEWISYAWELTFHAGISAATYFGVSKLKGIPKDKILTDIVALAAVTTPIQLGLYAPGRNILADYYMNNGMHPEIATLSAQGTLLVPYVLIAKSAFKKFSPKVEPYIRPKIEKYSNNSKKKIDKKIDKKTVLQKSVQKDVQVGDISEFIEKVS